MSLRLTAALGAACALAVIGTASALADSAGPSIDVPTQVEAGYWTAGCTSPAGCGAAAPPADPYPAHTLHVGVAGGQEVAATYLTLDTARLPAGATVRQGLLVLPVATDSGAGSANAAAADLVACLAGGPFGDSDFSTAAPPPVDCGVRSPATYHPGATEPFFTIDLAPFLAAREGTLAGVGIGLVPDPTDTSASWQVALNGRARDVAGQAPILAALTYTPPPAGEPLPGPPAAAGQPGTGPVGPVAAVAPAATQVAPPPPAAPAVAPLPAAPGARTAEALPAATPVAVVRGGQYGLVWAVPLGLMLLAYLILTTAGGDLRRSAGRPLRE